MPRNWEQREKKLTRRKEGMKVNSRGLITVIQPIIAKKGRQAKEKQREGANRKVQGLG